MCIKKASINWEIPVRSIFRSLVFEVLQARCNTDNKIEYLEIKTEVDYRISY